MTRGAGRAHGVAACIAAAGLFASAAAPLGAQRASPWLPPDHWSRGVLVRTHAAGLHALDPAILVHTVAEALAALPAAHRARLVEERFRADSVRAALLHVEVGLLLDARHDGLLPGGFDLDRVWILPAPQPDRAAAGARLRAESAPFERLALSAEIEALDGRARIEEATVNAALGGVGLWAGRRRHGFRPAEGGGFVLHRLERFDGAGITTLRRLAVPVLGPLAAEVYAGTAPRNGHVARPWLLAMRMHVRPHPRLDFGATRAAVFGRLDGGSVDAGAIAGVLFAANLSGDHADDQVASFDVRWRPPFAVPLELHGEWGMHDIDFGVLLDVPAVTVGVRLPDVLDGRQLGIGLEFTGITASCCANPPWYHHFELADGWTRDGRLLGHPLGGHGRQWRLHADADLHDAAVLLRTAAMLRWRGEENLFAPTREGRALALEASADARVNRRAAARLALFSEFGADWSELRLRALLRWGL